MSLVHKSLVMVAAAWVAPLAVGAAPARMQDFVTVQSQQSTTNYTDHYTIGANGHITLSKLAPVAASVTPVDEGGVLHMASSAPGRVAPRADDMHPVMQPAYGARPAGGRG